VDPAEAKAFLAAARGDRLYGWTARSPPGPVREPMPAESPRLTPADPTVIAR
jgi:hypothetical protein